MTSVTTAGDFDAAAINRVIERARSLPSIAAAYVGVGPVSTVADLSSVPTMTTATVATAFADVLASSIAHPSGMFLFSSGGTTAQPRHTLVPGEMSVRALTNGWSPFRSTDVVLNTFDAGRGWAIHYLTNSITVACGATCIAHGRLQADEMAPQFDLWQRLGLSAIAGTPTTLEAVLQHFHLRGEAMPLRTILWTGEPWTANGLELLKRYAADLEVWSMYGSTESWAVGVNTPGCSQNSYHMIDGIFAEIDGADRLLVTSYATQGGLVLRYVVGDRAAIEPCACGRPGVVLLGRADHRIKIFGSLFDAEAIVRTAAGCAGVAAAQLVLDTRTDGRRRVQISVVVPTGSNREVEADVLRAVLAANRDLDALVTHSTETIDVVRVSALHINQRTGKTPSVFRPAAD